VSFIQLPHGNENRQAAMEKAEAFIKKLKAKKLRKAAQKVKESIHETPAYYDFPGAHWNGSCGRSKEELESSVPFPMATRH